MCGIWGGREVNMNTLDLSDLLTHRGPDHQAMETVSAAGPPVTFGHTRLKVIDLRDVANQPMRSRDGRWILIFNGEIYNYRELRRQYCQDYPFVSDGDTEVLVALWHRFGTECLGKLRGMFAFALHDRNTGATFLCRDQLGIKPLYYVAKGSAFAFASEMTALSRLELGGGIRPEGVAEYLYRRYVPGEDTLLEGIRRVPAGHYVLCGASGPSEPKRYWTPPPVEARWNADDARNELDRRIVEAVKLQLRADVPIGVFLSGGLDSSLLSALMVREAAGKVDSFSISFDDPAMDESDAALFVANRLGTRHHRIDFTGTLKDWLPRIARSVDEPLADPALLPVYLLSQFARTRVVVALSGDGADELFGGYKQYRYDPLIPYFKAFAPLFRVAFSLTGWNERRERLVRVLSSRQDDHWPEWSGAFSFEDAERLSRARLATRNDATDLPGRLRIEIADSLVNRMLMKTDKMSMAHALEVRVPYLDQEVVDLAFRLPPGFKVNVWRDKILFRQVAERYLPSKTAFRRKHGFNLPISRWLRGQDRDFCQAVLLGRNGKFSALIDRAFVQRLIDEHVRAVHDHGLGLFALMQLSLWLDAVPSKQVH
jgi:asparagine synthase (glutamine-hydrolysing)